MTEEIQLSDAEKRLLRRVFHRHARPYAAALAVVALIALNSGSDDAAESETDGTVPAAAVEVEALRETQNRAEEQLAELAAARGKYAADLAAASKQIAGLEKRLEDATRRLSKAESAARDARKVADKASREAAKVASLQEELRSLAAVEKSLASGAQSNVPAAPAQRDSAP